MGKRKKKTPRNPLVTLILPPCIEFSLSSKKSVQRIPTVITPTLNKEEDEPVWIPQYVMSPLNWIYLEELWKALVDSFM